MFYSQLTVRETLLMAARLRLPRTMSLHDKIAMVDELINKLGLSKVGGGGGGGGVGGGGGGFCSCCRCCFPSKCCSFCVNSAAAAVVMLVAPYSSLHTVLLLQFHT